VVASYTVLYEGDVPARAVVVCDLPDGRRTLAATSDPVFAKAMTEDEICGQRVLVADRIVSRAA
jgi:hypothetical protein